MFCYKCGKQIQDDAIFCRFCGVSQKNENDINSPIVQKTSSGDYSTEALRVYFSNLLNLEMIIINLKNSIEKLECDINFSENNNYFQVYDIGIVPSWTYIWPAKQKYVQFRFDGSNYYFLAKRNGDYLGISDSCDRHVNRYLLAAEDYENPNAFWLQFAGNEKYLSSLWETGKESLFSSKIKTVYDSKVKEKVYKCFDDFKNNALTNYQNGVREISNKTQCLSGTTGELKKATELLQTAYDINIIPTQFRNVYAVYYLNDFIQTSNESLSTALLHFDLNEIKQKLDTVIEQQEEIIINQAIIQAQNEQMIKQNTNMLNSLASIEGNTHMASQYAEIAANNAEACAWIGVANYIKNN